ncbi:NlpC/P60 family protein [Sporosarcina siberiensis]|uniref:NlpC/P60 family protein n=1 Tax=Sporosarcina siberiensis TaxID=1365606 RepID=A0ABW4SBW7_9BACL
MKRFFYLIIASLIISTAVPTGASASTVTSLISSANNYKGTPYKLGGTTTAGFDCSAYVQRVFKDNGYSVPRDTRSQYATGTPVSKSNLQTGDLVFFNTSGKGVSHVGIYIGASNFIHASTSKGVMISSIYDPYYWGSKYVGARRVQNFTTPVPTPTKTDVATVTKPKAEVVVQPAKPTRADIALTIAEVLDLKATNIQIAFNDVSEDHPQIAAIAAVSEAGIFTGSEGSFKPQDNLTRAELAIVLVEAFGLEGRSDISFADVSESHWAKEYIDILYHNGITVGYADGRFGVEEYVSAGQLKAFINRIVNL